MPSAKDGEALAGFSEGEIIEVRRTVDGKTASYALSVTSSFVGSDYVDLKGTLIAHGFAGQVDRRIDLARANSTRLLEHLKQHCPRLLMTGPCTHMHDECEEL